MCADMLLLPNCFQKLICGSTGKLAQENLYYIQGLAGAPEEIRTPDPQIRSLVLYPAELRAHRAAGRIENLRRGTAVEL